MQTADISIESSPFLISEKSDQVIESHILLKAPLLAMGSALRTVTVLDLSDEPQRARREVLSSITGAALVECSEGGNDPF
jgi:hypothetical protein